MKNLTDCSITVVQQDGQRITLPAHPTPPTLRIEEPKMLGYLGAIEVIREQVLHVDFHGVTLHAEDQPFIVSREIFDALDDSMVEFVTPDLTSAILNSFKIPQAIRRFIAKAGAPDKHGEMDDPYRHCV